MIEIISILLNLLLGSSLLIFYSSQRRKQAAQATSAELQVRQGEFEIHRHSVEFLSKQLSEAYAEIDKMQEIINEKRNHIIELMRLSKQLEIDLMDSAAARSRALRTTCLRADCLERQQPTSNEDAA